MKKIALFILLAAVPAAADDWKDKLSPRMRDAFKDMAREDWKPQKAASLSEKEKDDLRQLWEQWQKQPATVPVPPPPPAPEGK